MLMHGGILCNWKENEIMTFAGEWMQLKMIMIMLNKTSLTQKDK